jgi:hypothetical protein
VENRFCHRGESKPVKERCWRPVPASLMGSTIRFTSATSGLPDTKRQGSEHESSQGNTGTARDRCGESHYDRPTYPIFSFRRPPQGEKRRKG